MSLHGPVWMALVRQLLADQQALKTAAFELVQQLANLHSCNGHIPC